MINTIICTCICDVDVYPDKVVITGAAEYSLTENGSTLSISSTKDIRVQTVDKPASISYINMRGGADIVVLEGACADSTAVRISYGGVCIIMGKELRNLDVKIMDGGEANAYHVSNKLIIDVVRQGTVRVHTLPGCDVTSSSTGEARIRLI